MRFISEALRLPSIIIPSDVTIPKLICPLARRFSSVALFADSFDSHRKSSMTLASAGSSGSRVWLCFSYDLTTLPTRPLYGL